MPRRSTNAFTLVELLVVVGIIATLIALLLPALNRARDMADTTKCAAQLHSFGIINALYSVDHQGQLFPTSFPGYTNPLTSVNYPGASMQTILSKYVTTVDKSRTIWVCPSAFRYVLATVQFPMTYACNQGIHPSAGVEDATTGRFWYWKDGRLPAASQKQFTLRKISKIRRSSEVVQMTDASLSSGAWTSTGVLTYTQMEYSEMYTASQADQPINKLGGWSWTPNADIGGTTYRMRYRHNGDRYGNALFLDGHVELALYNDQTHPNVGLRYRNFATGY